MLTAVFGADLAVLVALGGLGALAVGLRRLWRWYRRYTSPVVVKLDDP